MAENFCAQPHNLLENGGAPVDIWMSTKMMVATEPDWIRSTIEKYREWIESVQGVPIERMAVLQVSNRFTSLAARKILRGVPLNKLHNGPTAKLRAAVTSIEICIPKRAQDPVTGRTSGISVGAIAPLPFALNNSKEPSLPWRCPTMNTTQPAGVKS